MALNKTDTRDYYRQLYLPLSMLNYRPYLVKQSLYIYRLYENWYFQIRRYSTNVNMTKSYTWCKTLFKTRWSSTYRQTYLTEVKSLLFTFYSVLFNSLFEGHEQCFVFIVRTINSLNQNCFILFILNFGFECLEQIEFCACSCIDAPLSL